MKGALWLMPLNAFVVLNPVAGQSEPGQVMDLLERARSAGRLTYDLYETTGKEDLRLVVKQALEKQFDLVLACGGDGTVSGVADGLANTEISLGILPAGTTNAFATALGIPGELSEALDLLLSKHRIHLVDAIQHGERFFVLEASLGFFSAAFDEVEQNEKHRWGWLAYVDTVIRQWIGLDPLLVSLEIDGKGYHFRASELALFNTSQVGIINANLDAEIRLDDGRLDLYVLRSKTLWDLLLIVANRMMGHPKKAPHIRHWPVAWSVRITTDPTVSFQADGDVQGETPAVFRAAPAVLKVIVPETPSD